MKEPFLYEGSEPSAWTVSQVADLILLLNQHGVLDEMVKEADAAEIKVSLPPETINFTKRFLFSRKLHKKHDKFKAIVLSAVCFGKPVVVFFPPEPPPKPPPDGGVK